MVAMGGRPTRAIREFSPDETYPGSPDPKGKVARYEVYYWEDQVRLWKDFLVSERGCQDRNALESMSHGLPSTTAGTYDLHVALREYTCRTLPRPVRVIEHELPDFLREAIEENVKFYDRRLEDLDALIEELRKEKEQELLQEEDTQTLEAAPLGNTTTEQGSSEIVDRAEGDERDVPTQGDALPRPPFSEPAEGNQYQPQANASTKRKRSPSVDGAVDDLRHNRNASPRSKKLQRTSEAVVGGGNTSQGAQYALSEPASDVMWSEATGEPGMVSGEKQAEGLREWKLGEECETAKTNTDKSVRQDKENDKGKQDREDEQNTAERQDNSPNRRRTRAGKIAGGPKPKGMRGISGLPPPG